MAEPIARAIVRDVLEDLRAFKVDVDRLDADRQRQLRERLIHTVDARIKDGVLRLFEAPTSDVQRLTVLGGPDVLVERPRTR